MSTANYLIDQDYYVNQETKYAIMGHLLVLNPTNRDSRLKVTFYYEDDEPTETSLSARSLIRENWTWDEWPELRRHKRFAMRILSEEPVVVQATIGWNNRLNDYSAGRKDGERECAMAYSAITSLSKVAYYVDGVVIDTPKAWVRESEWNLILNPRERPAETVTTLYYTDGTVQKLNYTVQPERLKCIYLDDVVEKKMGYGTKIESTEPVAAQHLRVVYWTNKDETAYWANTPVMAFWSLPFCPAPPTPGGLRLHDFLSSIE